MERYIDIDKAIPMMIQMCVDIVGHGITQVDAARIATMLEDASVEDVAPKSEVAREIFEEIDKRFAALLGFYPCDGEFEDAKHFVDFHWKYIKKSIMSDYDAELKKKYTEERTD